MDPRVKRSIDMILRATLAYVQERENENEIVEPASATKLARLAKVSRTTFHTHFPKGWSDVCQALVARLEEEGATVPGSISRAAKSATADRDHAVATERRRQALSSPQFRRENLDQALRAGDLEGSCIAALDLIRAHDQSTRFDRVSDSEILAAWDRLCKKWNLRNAAAHEISIETVPMLMDLCVVITEYARKAEAKTEQAQLLSVIKVKQVQEQCALRMEDHAAAIFSRFHISRAEALISEDIDAEVQALLAAVGELKKVPAGHTVNPDEIRLLLARGAALLIAYRLIPEAEALRAEIGYLTTYLRFEDRRDALALVRYLDECGDSPAPLRAAIDGSEDGVGSAQEMVSGMVRVSRFSGIGDLLRARMLQKWACLPLESIEERFRASRGAEAPEVLRFALLEGSVDSYAIAIRHFRQLGCAGELSRTCREEMRSVNSFAAGLAEVRVQSDLEQIYYPERPLQDLLDSIDGVVLSRIIRPRLSLRDIAALRTHLTPLLRFLEYSETGRRTASAIEGPAGGWVSTAGRIP